MKKEEIISILADMPQMETKKVQQFNTLYKLMYDQKLDTRRYGSGYSAMNLSFIKYDLQKHFGITDLEITKAKEAPKASKEQLAEFDVLFDEVVGEVLPDKEQQTKLRADFPFLNEKDCPNELKILVADRITAYRNYKAGHQKMVDFEQGKIELTDEEKEALVNESMENFEENKLIFEELEHYQANKEILGKHPIFEDLVLAREVEAMTPDEKQSLISSTPTFLSANKKELAKEKDEEKKSAIQQKIDFRQKKLALVKASMGLTK